MNEITIRATGVLRYDDCPKAYQYQSVLGIQPTAPAANLAFGTAVHDACFGWLRAQLAGQVCDPVAIFQQSWQSATTASLSYAGKSAADLAAIGQRLVAQFPAAWFNSGLIPLLDPAGQPLIEPRLAVELVPGVILAGSPDLVVLDGDGQVAVVDLKTASQPAAAGFARVADQLTAYQLLVEHHRLALGIEAVQTVGFLELLKRKPNGSKGPEVLPPVLVSARTPAVLAQFHQKLVWVGQDIAAGRFPKRPRMAWNSPCTLCDFAGLCQRDDWTGLIAPGVVDRPLAPAP